MTRNYDTLIDKTLAKAPKVKAGQTALTSAPLGNGMVLCIEYHTVGDVNVCDDWQEMTSEHFDWKRAGVSNNKEWRQYLGRLLWGDYCAGYKWNKQ